MAFPTDPGPTMPFWCSVTIVLVLLAYSFVWPSIREELAFVRFRRRYDCERCRVHPDGNTWNGLFRSALAERRKQAAKDGKLTFSYAQDFELLGKTWEERLSHKRTINTIALPNIQYIYHDGFDNFPKSTASGKIGAAFLGSGILIADGAQWKRSRGLTRPLFIRTNVANLSVVEKHVDRFIHGVPRDGSTFDIQPLLKNLTDRISAITDSLEFTDISSDTLFGESFDSQLPKQLPGSREFLQAINQALIGWAKRRESGKWLFTYALDSKWKQACITAHSFVDTYVNRALEDVDRQNDKEASSVADRSDGYERLILLHEMAKRVKDPLELRFQILNIFLPTRDTTGILLANVFFQLARWPELWTQLRQCALALGDEPLTFERLQSLHPFRNVLYETLRHIGPMGRSTRTARADCVLPVGGGSDGKSPLFVPKGVSVCCPVRQLHHDKDLWGEDADEYKPERWTTKKAAWEFLGFSIGPRSCPGQQAAFIHATYLLVRMVSEFKSIENMDPVYEWKERATTVPIESWNGAKIALTLA